MTESNYLKHLGAKIKKKREDTELSQTELGSKVQLTRMEIYRIEKGKNPTSIIVLRRMAKVFKMKLSDLVTIED